MPSRAESRLLRAREFLRTLLGGTWSSPFLHLVVAHDAAENALRAILCARRITRQGRRRPDLIASNKKQHLEDVWPQLEPLLDDYAWLRTWKERARQGRLDDIQQADPEEQRAMIERAAKCAQQLVEIAEAVVRIPEPRYSGRFPRTS